MKKIQERLAEPAFALLRAFAGVMFACHGAQKLFGVFGATKMAAGKLLVAGIIEFGGGTLIALGLFASIAAFIASGEMAFAYFTSHAPHGFWPIVNHGELAVLYCFIWLVLWSHGSGPWSLDALLRKRSLRH